MTLTGDHTPVFTPEGPWSFHNPVKANFGRGVREKLADELEATRCLIVTTQRGRRQLTEDPLLGAFAANPAHTWVDSVTENPGLHDLQNTIDSLANSTFDAVVGFGGGSSLDSAKVIAVALSDECAGTPLSELLAQPQLHQSARPKPLYAVPTTAGTGSEVTPFSTVWDHETRKKHSLAGSAVFPQAAYVDPALTDTVPLETTLTTGLDAINQAAESIWNKNANPITLELATRALQLGLPALPKFVVNQGTSKERDQVSESSLLAGIAISQTRTALCHSLSYPLTAHFGIPHGLACAFTMPSVLRHNLAADDGRLHRLSGAIHGRQAAGHRELLDRFMTLNSILGVRERVRNYIMDREALMTLISEMATPGRADNTLISIQTSTIEAILAEAWET